MKRKRRPPPPRQPPRAWIRSLSADRRRALERPGVRIVGGRARPVPAVGQSVGRGGSLLVQPSGRALDRPQRRGRGPGAGRWTGRTRAWGFGAGAGRGRDSRAGCWSRYKRRSGSGRAPDSPPPTTRRPGHGVPSPRPRAPPPAVPGGGCAAWEAGGSGVPGGGGAPREAGPSGVPGKGYAPRSPAPRARAAPPTALTARRSPGGLTSASRPRRNRAAGGTVPPGTRLRGDSAPRGLGSAGTRLRGDSAPPGGSAQRPAAASADWAFSARSMPARDSVTRRRRASDGSADLSQASVAARVSSLTWSAG